MNVSVEAMFIHAIYIRTRSYFYGRRVSTEHNIRLVVAIQHSLIFAFSMSYPNLL